MKTDLLPKILSDSATAVLLASTMQVLVKILHPGMEPVGIFFGNTAAQSDLAVSSSWTTAQPIWEISWKVKQEGGKCFGITTNAHFFLVCTYEEYGENPAVVVYMKR